MADGTVFEQVPAPDRVAQLEKLRVPFAPEQVGKLPKPKRRDAQKGNCRDCGGYHGLPAVHLDYVGHAAVTDRLRQVDPFWTWEPFAIDTDGGPLVRVQGGTAIMWGRLTVCGVTRVGVGTCDAGKTERDKELIGDFLRNAAMRFGVGLDLWSKEELKEAELDATPAGPTSAPAPPPANGEQQAFAEGPPLRPPAPEAEPVEASAEDKDRIKALIEELPGTWKADIQVAWREAGLPSVRGKRFAPEHVAPAEKILAEFKSRWRHIQKAGALAREVLDGDEAAADVVIQHATEGRTDSLKACTITDLGRVIDTLERLKDGKAILDCDTEGNFTGVRAM